MYHEIVKKREPNYFAFLDQDMFMFKPFSIIPFLDHYGMWGDVDEPSNAKTPSLNKSDIVNGPWFVHPWLSFYRYDFVKDYHLDFMPCEHFDTLHKRCCYGLVCRTLSFTLTASILCK